jgi:PAS domain S-box-containing protein
MTTSSDGNIGQKRTNRSALERWERSAAIIQSAVEAFIVVDEAGRILLFNDAAEKMFGCPEKEAIGSHLEGLVAPSFRAELTAGFERVREANGDAASHGMATTLRGMRTNGEEFWGEALIARHDLASHPEFSVAIRDITERKQSEETVHHLVEFEAFLFDLSRTFIGLPVEKVDANMVQGLARVGEFLNMDRVTILELSPGGEDIVVAYSWSAPGVANAAPRITKEMQPWWVGQVLQGAVSLAADVNDLPREAALEKEYLRQRGVASVASIPLRVGGEIAGAISFVTTHRRESWNAALVSQLRAIGDILWNALKRRQAMQALHAAQDLVRASEERFRLIANTAPVMIWMSDVDKQVTYVNQPWLNFTGWPVDVVPGHRWIELIHADDVERCGEAYVKAFDQRQPFQIEHRLRRHDGEYRWTVSTGVPRYDADGSFTGYVGTAIDTTERKLAEDALSTLNQRLIQAQELERARLAQELHDDIGQRLTLLVLHLEAVKQRVEAPMSELALEIGSAIETAATLSRDVQSLSHRLHSTQLKHLGLEAAARAVCAELSERTTVDVQFHSEPPVAGLPQDVSLCLYRVLQEALQNAVKHSGSRRIDVWLRNDASSVELIVRDSGVGFEPNTAFQGGGLGLVGMRERLKAVGGELTIDARPAAGTTIRACVPLNVKVGFAAN